MEDAIQDEMVLALAKYIALPTFQGEFENFFVDNSLAFTDEEEHQLEYMEIYNKFQALFNRHLETFLNWQGITECDFEERCQQAIRDDPKADQFLEIVLASVDYDSFFNLMKAMRKRAALESRQADAKKGRNEGEASKGRDEEVKAAKRTDDEGENGHEAKGGRDEEEEEEGAKGGGDEKEEK